MKKRIVSILLCIAMCFGILAGCGIDVSNIPNNSNEGTSVEANTEVDNADDYMSGDPVKLKLVIYGDNNDANAAFISEKLRPRLIEELNIDLDLQFMSWGAMDQVHTMAMSGEAFGFMYDPANNGWSAEGIMATIPYEEFKRLAPHYLEARGINGFDWCKDPEGNIICIPMRSMPNPDIDGIAVRNDLLKEIGMDYTDIKTWDDYYNACLKIKEKFPEIDSYGTPAYAYILDNDILGVEDGVILSSIGNVWVSGGTATMVDEGDPESDEVINYFESEYFKNYCNVMHKFVQDGLRDADPLVEQAKGGWNAGTGFSAVAYTQMIYKYDELAAVEGSEVKVVRFKDSTDILKQDYNWTIAISVEDQANIEHWLRLIDWIYASEENYRFISIGEEGVDWEYAEDGVAINDLSDVSLVHDWMIATDKFEKVSVEKYGQEAVDAYWALNENAVASKAMGFMFDPTPVATEVALLNAIIQEKVELYAKGYKSIDDGWDTVLQELRDAGLDKLVAEVQKQFTDFMAKK